MACAKFLRIVTFYGATLVMRGKTHISRDINSLGWKDKAWVDQELERA